MSVQGIKDIARDDSSEAGTYLQQVAAIHLELGIEAAYLKECGLELQPECKNLVATELDVFERQPLMETEAFQAWQQMKQTAKSDRIELEIVSAYRSAEYQKQLFLNKIEKGQAISEILKINAAPGFSEHHSGQALDIGCPDYEHLSESFEQSSAFRWLSKNAKNFGFTLSFPRGNSLGFMYEPWHWKYFSSKG